MNEHREIFSVKADAIEVVKNKVYGGDFERPLPDPDSSGFYHYKDKKIRIRLSISPRDGWLSCSVVVWVLRPGWFKKPELVFATGFGYDVEVFRPGMWCDYVGRLASSSRLERGQLQQQQAASQVPKEPDQNFTPIDDSAIFGK
jgi:hypothetical protein